MPDDLEGYILGEIYEIYWALWECLADLLTKLKEKKEEIPADIIEDLRAARTVIEIIRAGGDPAENTPRIEEYLGKVEAYLVPIAQKKLGECYVKSLIEKMNSIRRGERLGKPRMPRRFIPGLPRDKEWVRIKISEDLTIEKILDLIKGSGLETEIQNDNYILVSGRKEEIRRFIKKMTKSIRKG